MSRPVLMWLFRRAKSMDEAGDLSEGKPLHSEALAVAHTPGDKEP